MQGVFVFDKKKKARVTVSTRGTELYVIVDAVRLIELDAKGKPIKQSTKSSAKKSQALASDAKAAQQQIESITAELKKLEGQNPNHCQNPLPSTKQRKSMTVKSVFAVSITISVRKCLVGFCRF